MYLHYHLVNTKLKKVDVGLLVPVSPIEWIVKGVGQNETVTG